MPLSEKKQQIKKHLHYFQQSQSVIFVDYGAMSVAQFADLRTQLGDKVNLVVAKNTLLQRAVKSYGLSSIDHIFTGPTAVACIDDDPVHSAKTFRQFSRMAPDLTIKGGWWDHQILSPHEIQEISHLHSRPELLTTMARFMNTLISQPVILAQQPLTKTAQLMHALIQKKEGEGHEYALVG